MKKILIGVLGCSLLACGCVKTDGKLDVSSAWTLTGNDSAYGSTVCKVIKAEGHRIWSSAVTIAFPPFTPKAAPAGRGKVYADIRHFVCRHS